MKIIYTRQSVIDLQRLRQFIADKNPKAANQIAERLVTAINRLTEFPYLGTTVQQTKGSNSPT